MNYFFYHTYTYLIGISFFDGAVQKVFLKNFKKVLHILLLFFGKRKYKLKIVIHTQKYIIYTTYIIFNNNELFLDKFSPNLKIFSIFFYILASKKA